MGVPLGIAAMLVLRLTGRKAGVAVMYHSVDHRFGDPGRELVPPHEAGLFEAQIRFLVKHYRVVPAADLAQEAEALALQVAAFPQTCMRNDRRSA